MSQIISTSASLTLNVGSNTADTVNLQEFPGYFGRVEYSENSTYLALDLDQFSLIQLTLKMP
jgi:hypothetical protein